MGLDEILALHKHAAGTAARVVYAALIGRQHFDQHADDVRRRIKLAATLALSASEARQKILIYATERILRTIRRRTERDVADQINNLTKSLLVEAGAGEVLRQYALERWVVALDRAHGVVDQLADGRLRSHRLEIGPTRLGRYPEDIDGSILVRVF